MVNKLKELNQKYKEIPVQVKASLWYTICSVVQKCIVLLTFPIFTRLMSTQQYGQYSIYQSWLNLLIIFGTLNMQYGSFDTAMIKFEHDRDRYIASIQGVCTLLTLCLVLIYAISPTFWNDLIGLPTILMLTMFIEILFSTVIMFWTNKERFVYKYKSMIIVTLLISILSPLLGLIAVLTFKEKGIARIVANSLVYFGIGLCFYIYHISKGKTFYDKKYWLYALKFNIPLVPYYISQMIFNESDRIMISKMCGLDQAAMYSVAYQFGILLVFIINAVNGSFVPWMYRNIKENHFDAIKKITNFLVAFVAVMLGTLILFGPEAIAILGGKQYQGAIWVIPPVAGSMLFLFLSQISINIMFYFEEKAYLVKGSILSAIINIILNYIGIKMFGYIAPGYTTLISYMIFWVANLYFMNKVCVNKIANYNKNTIVDFDYLIKCAIIFVLSIILLTLTYFVIWLRILVALVIVYLFWKYRNIITDYLKIMKS